MNRTPPRMRDTTDTAEHRMNELLAQASRRAWTGPDRSPRVEEHLKGLSMKSHHKVTLTRSALILIGLGAVAGGSLAAAVTHQVLTRRATLIADDGTQYDVELTETPDGAAGTFVTDDGTVYGIEMVESGAQNQVTVDVNSPNGGMSTVILDNGVAPSILTAPGQTARIQITEDVSDDDTSDDGVNESDGDDD